jgi:hypothetical protein
MAEKKELRVRGVKMIKNLICPNTENCVAYKTLKAYDNTIEKKIDIIEFDKEYSCFAFKSVYGYKKILDCALVKSLNNQEKILNFLNLKK